MRYQNRWDERRLASGGLKPCLFLIIEIIALLMVCWFVSLFGVLFMTVLVSIGAIYFFMTSALPRYHKAKKRQKNS